jgi:hypothetical protein
MKGTIFWNMTPCSLLKVNRSFGGTYCFHLQGTSACHLLWSRLLARLILRSWRWRRHVPPKFQLTFNGLHGAISQKIVPYTNFIHYNLIHNVIHRSNPNKYAYILWHVNALLGNVLVNKFPRRQILDKLFVARLRYNRWGCFPWGLCWVLIREVNAVTVSSDCRSRSY